MTLSRRELLAAGAAAPWLAAAGRPGGPGAGQASATFVSGDGVWRWRSDGREVALFGVNYDLASASAFRFAKASGMAFADIVERDFAHFRRLGFDALRLCFWGDWESTTRDGRLIENEHLAVLDLAIARAAAAGLSLLLSPIATYDASWPDAMDRARDGISSAYDKAVLGTDRAAITAQARYLAQLLARTNPHTGRTYAAEPAIVAIEPINEPEHHSRDVAGSRAYIEALVGAIRSSGFAGPVFYNVSQDMKMARVIGDAPLQGATFAWYPTGLQNGHAVAGNALLLVEDYAQMRDPALSRRAKLVYEFDAADSMASYVYPAMVREFREGGAQFAAMFAYDPYPIAASNSEFNDHFLNLAYTPAKAISALIAACAMRELPRGGDHGRYPANMRFGPVRVDDRADLSELIDSSRFFHSNDTQSRPAHPQQLERLAGCGSSPLVRYDGTGAWFLDRDAAGEWRLEVYPDAALIANPFAFRRPSRGAVRIVHRARDMRIDLPDLGANFAINDSAGRRATARDGGFSVRPGVHRLSRNGHGDIEKLPRYFAPAADAFAPILQHEPPESLTAGSTWHIAIDIVAPEAPKTVLLCLRLGGKIRKTEMRPGRGFRYEATIAGEALRPGFLEYYIAIESVDGTRLWPGGDGASPGGWDYPRTGGYRVPVLPRDAPLALFDASREGARIVVPYGGYASFPAIALAPDETGRAEIRFDGATIHDQAERDIPMQFAWNGVLDRQGRALESLSAIIVEGRSLGRSTGAAGIILIERDGMAWGTRILLASSGAAVRVPLRALRPVRAAMLPRDFPKGINPYWLRVPEGRGGAGDALRVDDLQAVQVTLAQRFLFASDDPAPRFAIRRIMLAR